jgi:hypothetical protein
MVEPVRTIGQVPLRNRSAQYRESGRFAIVSLVFDRQVPGSIRSAGLLLSVLAILLLQGPSGSGAPWFGAWAECWRVAFGATGHGVAEFGSERYPLPPVSAKKDLVFNEIQSGRHRKE